MKPELDITKFQGVGVCTDNKGKEYLIMVRRDLPEERKDEIVMDMVFGKIDVKKCRYVPEKEILDRLRLEWK